MIIGRFHFEWTSQSAWYTSWSESKGSCGCRFFSFGHLEITYFDKGCRCVRCDNYICECDKDKE